MCKHCSTAVRGELGGGGGGGHPQCVPASFEVSADCTIVMPVGRSLCFPRQGSEEPADKTRDPGVKLTL